MVKKYPRHDHYKCLMCESKVKIYSLAGYRYCYWHYFKEYIINKNNWKHVWYKITWELYRKYK